MRGVEAILGVQRDAVLRPIVMFGFGGIFVQAKARAVIESGAAYPFLTGLRGQPPADPYFRSPPHLGKSRSG